MTKTHSYRSLQEMLNHVREMEDANYSVKLIIPLPGEVIGGSLVQFVVVYESQFENVAPASIFGTTAEPGYRR